MLLFTHRRSRFALVFLIGALSILSWAPSAAATPACTAQSLSTILFNPCTIGSLQIDLINFGSVNDNTGGTLWTASDFTFTPLSNGFTLSFDGGMQSITGTSSSTALDVADMEIETMGVITGVHISGGNVTADTNTQADYGVIVDDTKSSSFFQSEELAQGGEAESLNTISSGSPFSDGSGEIDAFRLSSHGSGDTATWDGSDTTITFDTVTPEPDSYLLFGTGLVGILAVASRKFKIV